MTDDPVEAKLDVLVHSAMEARGETRRSLRAILRTQWLTCAICVFAVLAAAVAIFKSLPA